MTSSDGKHVAGAGGPTRNPTTNKHGVTPALSSPARLRADSGAGKEGGGDNRGDCAADNEAYRKAG